MDPLTTIANFTDVPGALAGRTQAWCQQWQDSTLCGDYNRDVTVEFRPYQLVAHAHYMFMRDMRALKNCLRTNSTFAHRTWLRNWPRLWQKGLNRGYVGGGEGPFPRITGNNFWQKGNQK